MDQYKLQHEKGSGTFSIVFTAQSIQNHRKVAIKCMKKKFDTINKVKKLKEIQALNILSNHDSIIKLLEVLYDEPSGKLALVFELMQMNLYQFLVNKKGANTYQKIRHYMYQVLKAIQYMHRKGIFHRDIKPQNILVKGNTAKLADLGSCKGIHSKHPYTDYISTRWYRAPECLLTDGYYNQKMDIWGFGCVLFQLVTKKPLFPGKDQLDQINRIHNILGTPNEDILSYFRQHATHMQINFPKIKAIGIDRFLPKDCPKDLRSILNQLLVYDYKQRISAVDALQHQYFQDLNEQKLNTSYDSQLINLRSTFFTMKNSQIHQPRKRDQTDRSDEKHQLKKQTIKSENKNNVSKKKFIKVQDEKILPKITGTTHYGTFKKSMYNKKLSNQLGLPDKKGN